MRSLNGHQAFDELVDEGFMEVNEVGLGRIVKAPKLTNGPRGRRELNWFVRCVTAMSAWATSERHGVQRSCGCDGDDLRFRKVIQSANPLCGGCAVNHPHEHRCWHNGCPCPGCNPSAEELAVFRAELEAETLEPSS